ncbi:hypothetical protein M406DRAFT_98428 [Cryphonectria parasitica EP155]|uniref:Major facilitator superfamily (MFS) profile domain-containing protein n=1 Tax=Cryphonectria parasitica (strain ATCC 38755 / EP155) TaxID=660469 RepID=A0A9P4Y146_CRYP1|nr:uncharacterized protein M406DRAFT_98428 [Cryphonectria parasitica EP155]KAF3764621.1 hypothetical protein M406DRAFT_98428 [Cryphonectria parasitica EP155]
MGTEMEYSSPTSDSEKPEVSDRENELPASAAPDANSSGHGPIPNGGLQAWLQVLGSWVVLVATWGLVNTFGVFQTYYETELLSTSSSASISWIGSIQACLLMLVGVVAGPLYDAGFFRYLLSTGLLLIIFGQFMISLGTAYWHILLAQGVCVGIGMGLIMLPSTAILAQYFTTRRALAIGIASSGSPIAGIVFPIVFSNLVNRVGFGWATRVIAFILLGLSAIPVVFMRTRVPPSGRKRALIDTDALRDPAFVLFVSASFFLFLCLYTAFFYLQLFDELHGLSSLAFAPYTVTLLNVGSVFGRLLPNYFADKVGSVNTCLACAAVSAVLLLGWLGIHNLGGLVVFALLYGLFSGGIVSVTPSAVMSMSPDMSRVGTRMGMTFMLAGFSILLGTPIAGWILGGFSESEWKGVIGYSAAGVTVGTCLYAGSRLVLYRRNGKLVA